MIYILRHIMEANFHHVKNHNFDIKVEIMKY